MIEDRDEQFPTVEAVIEAVIADLAKRPDEFAFEAVYEEAVKIGQLPASFIEAVQSIGDEKIADIFAEVADTIEHVIAPLRWTQDVIRHELTRRMDERRGDSTGTIEIPHPLIEISSTPDWEPYQYDVDQLVEAFRGLPDDEVDKLLKVEPARSYSNYGLSDVQRAAVKVAIRIMKDVGAALLGNDIAVLEALLDTTTVAETVTVRNATSMQAWLKRNAGSPRAKIAALAIKRNMRGVKVTIRPKNTPKRVDPALPAIEGAQ